MCTSHELIENGLILNFPNNEKKNMLLSFVRGYHRTNTIGGSHHDNNRTR